MKTRGHGRRGDEGDEMNRQLFEKEVQSGNLSLTHSGGGRLQLGKKG